MVAPGRDPRSKSSGSPFLFVSEAECLVDHLRDLLNTLLDEVVPEVLPQDGPVVLARLRGPRPRLTFLSTEMRGMDALTLLRALPPGRARQVVLLVPDTLEGYRAAWDGIAAGARDFIVTRGTPPQRCRGSVGQRLRQLASLLGDGREDPPARGPVDAVPGALTASRETPEDGPWVVLADTWNLAEVGDWLQGLAPLAPVVVRLPEGPRLLRVARENLGRLMNWPVRALVSGDRLVRGHVHLLAGTDTVRLEEQAGYLVARVRPSAGPPGSWGAYHDLLRSLRGSHGGLRIVLPEAAGEEEESFLIQDGTHGVYHLRRSAEEAAEPVLPACGERDCA